VVISYGETLVDDAKIDGMILSLKQLASQEDPIGQVRLILPTTTGDQ
jgi:gamma-glutamyl phosphate reductase